MKLFYLNPCLCVLLAGCGGTSSSPSAPTTSTSSGATVVSLPGHATWRDASNLGDPTDWQFDQRHCHGPGTWRHRARNNSRDHQRIYGYGLRDDSGRWLSGSFSELRRNWLCNASRSGNRNDGTLHLATRRWLHAAQCPHSRNTDAAAGWLANCRREAK
jgi:hypothetical protein